MGLNGECKDNKDCSKEQFCYTISKRCVDHVNCSRYNRMEGQVPAQEPSQCGPCMKGYAFEILANDQETDSCKYVENQAGSYFTNNQITTFVVPFAITFGLLAALMGYAFYKYRRESQNCRSSSNNAPDIALDNSNTIAIASAPPEDQRPFIGCGEKKCRIPDNYNKRVTETNEYQASVPYTTVYRHIGAYASTNNNSNSNNNLPSREITVYEAPEDQRDRNTETSQTDLSNHNDDNLSNHNDDNLSNHNDDNLSNHNDDDGDTIDSGSEPNNKGNKRKSGLTINQVVQQNITINLNGEEY